MTPEQRASYAAVLRNPPYPEDRNFLYNTKISIIVPDDAPVGDPGVTVSTRHTCSIGAIYSVVVKDIFNDKHAMTTPCCQALGISDQEAELIMQLNMLGGYAAVTEWLETGLVPPEHLPSIWEGFGA